MPPAAQRAETIGVRGAVGQGPRERGGDDRGDRAQARDDPERGDLVLGNALQLERQQDLDRRQGCHPHAQAGQAEPGDPAPADVHSRLGERERIRVLLFDRLVSHDTSAC